MACYVSWIRRGVVVALLFAGPAPLFAQATGAVAGTVFGAGTERPVAGVRLALPTSPSGSPGNAWRQSVWVTGPGWWPETVGLADPWPVLHAERVFVSALLRDSQEMAQPPS